MNVAREIQFGNTKIMYRVKRTTRKKTSEIIIDKNGVRIIVPKEKLDKEIRDLVELNSKWIYKKQLEKLVRIKTKHQQKQASLLYRGKYYSVNIKKALKNSITLKNGKFQIGLTDSTTKIDELYRNWLRDHASKIIEKQFVSMSRRIKINYNK